MVLSYMLRFNDRGAYASWFLWKNWGQYVIEIYLECSIGLSSNTILGSKLWVFLTTRNSVIFPQHIPYCIIDSSVSRDFSSSSPIALDRLPKLNLIAVFRLGRKFPTLFPVRSCHTGWRKRLPRWFLSFSERHVQSWGDRPCPLRLWVRCCVCRVSVVARRLRPTWCNRSQNGHSRMFLDGLCVWTCPASTLSLMKGTKPLNGKRPFCRPVRFFTVPQTSQWCLVQLHREGFGFFYIFFSREMLNFVELSMDLPGRACGFASACAQRLDLRESSTPCRYIFVPVVLTMCVVQTWGLYL